MQTDRKLAMKVITDKTADLTKEPDFSFDAPGVEGYIIGRSDTASSYEPDIDLSPHGAQHRGISRRHAALVAHRNLVHIIDLGSMNGTFVNGKQISPKVAYALNDGDQLSFGNLDVVITRLT